MASPGFSELNQPVTVSTQWLMQPELIDGIDRLIRFTAEFFLGPVWAVSHYLNCGGSDDESLWSVRHLTVMAGNGYW